MSSRLNNKFKFIITALDQLVHLGKNMSKYLYSACIKQRQKQSVLNPLKVTIHYDKQHSNLKEFT